jgi:hypothetical protein
LEKVIADMEKQLKQHDFSTDFTSWHGKPLWEKALIIKASDKKFGCLINSKRKKCNCIFYCMGSKRFVHV